MSEKGPEKHLSHGGIPSDWRPSNQKEADTAALLWFDIIRAYVPEVQKAPAPIFEGDRAIAGLARFNGLNPSDIVIPERYTH